MKSFIDLIDESFDQFNLGIWKSLSHRLSLSVSIDFPTERFPCLFDSISCQYSKISSGHSEGIISYLTRKHCGHVMDRNVISITASSVHNSQSYPLRHLADFENQSLFLTEDKPNSWICYDFKNILVNLTHYSVRSRRDADCHHLRSWILEGSIDCESWIEMDHQENNASLNSQGAISTFIISSSIDFRYIRLRQIGMNSNGSHYLIVNSIEFFGILKTPKH
jgi:hypothetical protein